MSEEVIDSAYHRRAAISELVTNGVTDGAVLSHLIMNGRAISDEAVLWDFKIEVPVLPNGIKLSDSAKRSYDAKFAEIVKDCVAFYNSYGGYLVIGIDNASRTPRGFSAVFDAADLNKRIQAATQVSIETIYRVVTFSDSDTPPIQLGILFVPKRSTGVKPAAFKKDAPERENGLRAYRLDEFYFRERDNCRAAKAPEDFEFLFSQRLIDVPYRRKKFIENNLPPRDQELKHLIGREEQLTELWSWLPDVFSPVKILSGLGGVGKTSIAYTFAERLLYQSPEYIDKILWLGAKTETYLGLRGTFADTRLDFETIDELLTNIILEAGCPPEQVPEKPSRQELMTLAQHHLGFHSYILVIDNVDTLNDDDQKKILSLITQLCSVAKAKAIVTARRNLGAAFDMYIDLKGLAFSDFQALVQEKCAVLKLRPPAEGSVEMTRFYEASGGSPLFALSIIRLVNLGDTFSEAVSHWGGSQGEQVRDIAFRRELNRLTANAAKVLLALSYLTRASVVELGSVLGLTHADVQTALADLEEFSMTARDTSLPGGAAFKVPSMMGLITPQVEKVVTDHVAIRTKCREFQTLRGTKTPFVGTAISRTMAFLNSGDSRKALQTAKAALDKLPDDPDLLCLIGRIYNSTGDAPKADESFRAAFSRGCKKRELFGEWVALREERGDWPGVIEIAKIANESFDSARFIVARCNAEMMIGDEASRIGRHSEAESKYENAAKDIQNALRDNDIPGERADLWKLNRSLVVRWLGAVRMQVSNLDGKRRFFGACAKAIRTYRLLSKDVLLSGCSALREWTHDNLARSTVTDRIRTDADVNERRLKDLRTFVVSRSEFSQLSVIELEQMDQLILDLAKIAKK
ncbi:RNA-binding domain-containing protein [Bradyrhizobium sp. WSM2254]|uniref:RNA-binding domain-containing protein n=1 Tax=Bradyrhizobium sp. WSM2254 TaxID=1188263 RepID=UPI00041FE889|nr:RNA-binding domain-containing protein [Bradyrhizobium sp. WSM2254]